MISWIPKLATQMTFLLLAGCALVKPFPSPITTAERLAMFPTDGLVLNGPAEIFWNDHQIPFIHASEDQDIPYLLGMVHAHLRLGQMELLRRVSQGRLSEMFGPWAADIDHSLRILNFGKAVPAMLKSMPSHTREWLQRYTEGINAYIQRMSRPTSELSVLGIVPSAWSAEEVLTLGRLTATDVNWLFWFFQLRIHNEPAWPELWNRIKALGQSSQPSFGDKDGLPIQLLGGAMKSGSNALVISGRRTANGSGLIAGDPHLGLMLPNFWVLVGYRSPGYRVVGFTIPGVPAIVVGRNENIAWGGTNMLSLSSTIFDISDLPENSLKPREERIQVRWWLDRSVTIRDSNLGPVISDSPMLKKYELPRLALKWRGHAPSHELSALLAVNRAASWEAFRQAFESYAVSGQNMLYADRQGNIGLVPAVEFAPAAGMANQKFVADPSDPLHTGSTILKSTDLPSIVNPSEGFLVSANNQPVKTDPPLSLFGNSNDRYTLLSQRIKRANPISIADLKILQQDVYSNTSLALGREIAARAPETTVNTEALLEALRLWDGNYTVDSKGAAALELIAYHLVENYYGKRYGKSITRYLLRSPAIYAFLLQDIESKALDSAIHDALLSAAADFKDHPSWGDLHVLKLAHPLGNFPLLGRKYRFGEYPAPGSTNTVMKRAHPLSNKKRSVTYGANARHISDLSDPDANWFALLGGQDGYWGSDNYLDLFQLWQKNDYVQVPLNLESIRDRFSNRMELQLED